MHKIQQRITVSFVCLFVICLAALGIYLVSYVKNVQTSHLQSQLTDEARLVAAISSPIFTSPDHQAQLESIAKTLGNEVQVRITIIAKDGTVLGDTDQDPSTMENHSTRPEVVSALNSGIGQATRYSTTLHENMMYVALPVTSNGQVVGVSRVALPLAAVQSSVNGIILTIVLAVLITAALVILASAIIARMMTRPIRRITTAAEEIASGKLDQQIPVSTNNEIGRLGAAFNNMAANVKTLVDNISENETRLSTVLGNMTDGVIMTDKNGDIILANKAAGRLFNFAEDKVTSLSLIQAAHDHEADEILKKCLSTGTLQTGQLEAVPSRRFLRVVAIPLSGQKISGALLLFQDLTEVRAIQTMRRELIANISHDFRTPIAGIKAMVETLQNGAINDKKAARDFLVRIDGEVDRLTQMVSELTELSHIETGKALIKIMPVDINSLVDDVIKHMAPLAEKQRVSLNAQATNPPPVISIDKDRIRQTLVNLVHNAIKFNRPGGSVSITVSANQSEISIAVKDTGIGIAPDDLPHVFERFYKADRARGGGSGLGLAIAKHTVQAHGGTIRAESEEGKGSVFIISLPRQS